MQMLHNLRVKKKPPFELRPDVLLSIAGIGAAHNPEVQCS